MIGLIGLRCYSEYRFLADPLVVLAAQDKLSPDSAAALEALCWTYWYPLYAYVRGSGQAPEDGQDLTQEFLSESARKWKPAEHSFYLRVIFVVPPHASLIHVAEVTECPANHNHALSGFGKVMLHHLTGLSRRLARDWPW